MIPSERLATDVGKHFGQTLIELSRKILVRRHASSIQIDISRSLTTDISRKRQGENQLGQTLIKPIRQKDKEDIGLIQEDIK